MAQIRFIKPNLNEYFILGDNQRVRDIFTQIYQGSQVTPLGVSTLVGLVRETLKFRTNLHPSTLPELYSTMKTLLHEKLSESVLPMVQSHIIQELETAKNDGSDILMPDLIEYGFQVMDYVVMYHLISLMIQHRFKHITDAIDISSKNPSTNVDEIADLNHVSRDEIYQYRDTGALFFDVYDVYETIIENTQFEFLPYFWSLVPNEYRVIFFSGLRLCPIDILKFGSESQIVGRGAYSQLAIRLTHREFPSDTTFSRSALAGIDRFLDHLVRYAGYEFTQRSEYTDFLKYCDITLTPEDRNRFIDQGQPLSDEMINRFLFAMSLDLLPVLKGRQSHRITFDDIFAVLFTDSRRYLNLFTPYYAIDEFNEPNDPKCRFLGYSREQQIVSVVPNPPITTPLIVSPPITPIIYSAPITPYPSPILLPGQVYQTPIRVRSPIRTQIRIGSPPRTPPRLIRTASPSRPISPRSTSPSRVSPRLTSSRSTSPSRVSPRSSRLTSSRSTSPSRESPRRTSSPTRTPVRQRIMAQVHRSP